MTTHPRDNRPPGHPDPRKLFVTSEVYHENGSWWMTVRLERLTDSWTSAPMWLEATTSQEAQADAAIRVSKLLAVISPE